MKHLFICNVGEIVLRWYSLAMEHFDQIISLVLFRGLERREKNFSFIPVVPTRACTKSILSKNVSFALRQPK